MDIIKDKNIVYIKNEEGKMIAYCTFPKVGEGLVMIDHTVVDPSLRGQGIAGKLMSEAYESIKEQGLRVRPVCSYAVGWFEKNPDKKDILE